MPSRLVPSELHHRLRERLHASMAAPREPVALADPVRRRGITLPNWVPKSGLGRIRWLFLGFALFSIASAWPAMLSGSSTASEFRGPGVIAGLILAGLWIHGYRQARFPLKSVVLECVAYVVLAISFASPLAVFGLLFPAANFRGTYGSKRDLTAAVLALMLGCVAYPLLVDRMTLLAALALAGPALIGLPLSAVMMYVLAKNLARHERSAARERALARAGADLMAATNRDDVVEAVLTAVLAMLEGAGVVVSRISLSTLAGDDQLSVIAARGLEAARIEGAHMPLNRLPSVPHTARPEQSQYTVNAATAAAVTELLGYAPHPGTMTLTRLSLNGESTGLLGVESPSALPAECGDGLLTLSAEAALALGAIQLTRDLRHDIEQRRALEAQLVYQASHDPLTGLPNRALFFERTQRAIDQAGVHGQPVAVLFIDLDGFKAINDGLGHAAGDQLLVEVSSRLQAGSTDGTLVGRLGGDEFAVLVERIDGPEVPVRLAADILDRLKRPARVTGRMVIVGASVGSATSTPETGRADELVRNADTAMYAAKNAGKGRSAVYQADWRDAKLARHAKRGQRSRAARGATHRDGPRGDLRRSAKPRRP